MQRISSKTVQVLFVGCLSLAIATFPSTQGTEAFAASDSVSSSYSVDTLSVNDRQMTNEPQSIHSSGATDAFVLGIGAVFGMILLLVASSRSNSRQAGNSNPLARPSSRNVPNSLSIWSTMQANNDLSSNTSSDCSSSTSNSSTSSDCSSTSWSGSDCGGGSSWGGDSGGGSWGGGGDCGGGSSGGSSSGS